MTSPRRIFDFSEVVLLLEVLRRLERLADRCIVRGMAADRDRVLHGGRRLLHHDPDTGDQATLCQLSRRWTVLNIEGLSGPSEIDPEELVACGRAARAQLPAAFKDDYAWPTVAAPPNRNVRVAEGKRGARP